MQIVASDVGGIPEVIRDEKEGILMEPGNTESITINIREALENYDKTKRLGNKAKERLEDIFDLDKILEEHINVYNQIYDPIS